MFEKEAIRHAFEATIGIECLSKPVEDFTYEELSDKLQEKADDYQNGAEFGYNKAFVEADKNLKAVVADFNKANEWHYVKDGDLPKDEDWKWCVSYRGYYYVARYEEMFGCWTNQEHSEVMQPYAWKEIVLPELKESE